MRSTDDHGPPDPVRIECASCAMQHSEHCRDCIVSVLLTPAARRSALVIDADEHRALRELADAGLVPQIRMRARTRTRSA